MVPCLPPSDGDRYFNRDVECIRTFFRRRFQYESALYPRFKRVMEEGSEEPDFRLDIMVEASGFGRKEMKVLEEASVVIESGVRLTTSSIWSKSRVKKT